LNIAKAASRIEINMKRTVDSKVAIYDFVHQIKGANEVKTYIFIDKIINNMSFFSS
jgi:isocitrate dehydrogenase